jgi:hypothetical protein
MGCCDEAVTRTQQFHGLDGLPDSTFCCMAKMGYALFCEAEHFYTGRRRVAWEQLLLEDRNALAAQTKAALRAVPPNPAEQFDVLFYNLVRVVTSTV